METVSYTLLRTMRELPLGDYDSHGKVFGKEGKELVSQRSSRRSILKKLTTHSLEGKQRGG